MTTDRPSVPTADRVLVVGAGPAGLAAGAALSDLDLEFDIVEEQKHVGGVWNTASSGRVVDPDLQMVTSKGSSQFADLVMPVSFPSFPRAEEMGTYLRAYTSFRELEPRIVRGRGVSSARRLRSGQWEVRFTDGRIAPYRAVVGATGTSHTPHFPDWVPRRPEVEIVHSSQLDPASCAGRDVLVVGGGTSAAGAAVALAGTAASVRLSMRRGHWVVPREILGAPGDRLRAWQPAALGGLNRRLAESVISRLYGRPEELGLPAPEADLLRDRLIVSDDLFDELTHGRVTPAPAVSALRADGGVRFADTTTATPDVIVCATGFEPDYSWLDADLRPGSDQDDATSTATDLFLGAFPRHVDDLVLLGQFRTNTGAGPLLMEQARIAALVLRAVWGDGAGNGTDEHAAGIFRGVRTTDPVSEILPPADPIEPHFPFYLGDDLRYALRGVRNGLEPADG